MAFSEMFRGYEKIHIHECGHLALGLTTPGALVKVESDFDGGYTTSSSAPPPNLEAFLMQMVAGGVMEAISQNTFISDIKKGWRQIMATEACADDLEQLEIFGNTLDAEITIACVKVSQILRNTVTREMLDVVAGIEPGNFVTLRNNAAVH